MSAESDTISFVAEAISLYATNEAKSALTAKNRAYFEKLMKYGISFDREGKQLSPNGKYDFSKLPYYWVQ